VSIKKMWLHFLDIWKTGTYWWEYWIQIFSWFYMHNLLSIGHFYHGN